MKNNSQKIEQLPPEQKKNAFFVAIAMSVILVFASLYYFSPLTDIAVTFFHANVQLAILAAVYAFSAFLVHRGKGKTAVVLMISATHLVMLITTLVTSGLDIMLSILNSVITFGIASMTLSTKETTKAMYANTAVVAYLLFLYFVEPFERTPLIAYNDASPYIVGFFVLAFIAIIIRQFASYALRTKLVVSFVFLSSLGIGIAFILVTFNMRRILQDQAQERLVAGASASAEKIDSFLKYSIDTVASAAGYFDLRTYLLLPSEERKGTQTERQIQYLLFALKNRNTDILSFGLLDLNGVNIADSNTRNIGTSEAQQDYFQLPLNAKTTYISPVLYFPDEEEGFIFFSAPIYNDMGGMLGILRAKYRASVLQDLLESEENLAGKDAFSILFDSNHIVLAHGINPDQIGKISFTPSLDESEKLKQNFLLPSQTSIEELSLNIPAVEEGLSNFASAPYFSNQETESGIIVSGAITQLDNVPWLVVSAQPEAIILAPVQRQTQQALFVAILISIFAALLGLGLSNVLVAPILRLQRAAQQFTEGDLEIRATVDTNDEIGSLAATFNNLTTELSQTVETLEVRIEERTKDLASRTSYLESAAEVSHAVSSIMSPDALASEVTELIKERFDLYYAGLFLVDQNNEWAVLKAGTGQAGQKMLANKHKIKIGEGMIGWSIQHAESRIALDVGEDAVRFENPYLLETRSEGALPLRSRGRVLGALTVQSTEEAAFDASIITTLQTMVDQIAIAFDNAELFVKAEEALLAERRAYGQLSQQAWQALTQNRSIPRFIVTEDGTANTISNPNKSIDIVEVAKKGEFVQDDNLTVVMPIKNRDYVLGGIKISKKKDSTPWSTEELTVIQTISEQLSVAVESARLFEETQRKAERERTITEISASISAASEVERVLQTTVEELGQRIGSARNIKIFMAEADSQKDSDKEE